MCTLVVATRVWGGTPLVVAGNRDERLARPAAPPHHWSRDDEATFFAPRDLQAGGTWLGVRGANLLVAITNRYRGVIEPPGPRSRGELVVDALVAGDVQTAAQKIAAYDPKQHSPFHLLIADRDAAHLVWNDGDRHHHEQLAPGFHVISERSRGAAPTERDGHLLTQIQPWAEHEPPPLTQWQALLSEHRDPSMEGPCVHLDGHDYGTRSSTIVRMPADPATLDFFHAEGPPCRSDYRDLSSNALARD